MARNSKKSADVKVTENVAPQTPEVETAPVSVAETPAEAPAESAAEVTSEVNTEVAPEAPATDVNSEDNIKECLEKDMKDAVVSIDALIAEYNEKGKYLQNSAMQKIKENIEKQIKKHNDASETLMFNQLKKSDNVMLAAVKQLTFPAVSVIESQDSAKHPVMTRKDKNKRIDPLRLHNKVDGGIGHDKNWRYIVEALNFRMTCSRAMQLGIDPTSISDSYAMKDESKNIAGLNTVIALTDEQKALAGTDKIVVFDYNAANQMLKTDLQTLLDAMVGPGYTINEYMVAYMNSVYAKRENKTALTVGCANHKNMRSYVMDVCHAAVTGRAFNIKYSEK